MHRKALMILLCAMTVCTALLLFCSAAPQEASSPPSEPVTRSTELGLILLDSSEGLFVLAITENSPAGHAGFCAGDLLLYAGETPLTSYAILESLITNEPDSLFIQLERNGDTLYLELPTTLDLAKGPLFHYTELMH